MGRVIFAHPAVRPVFWPRLPFTQSAGKEQNQTNQQDESKPTSAHQWSAEIKSAAAEQKHQHNKYNKEIHIATLVLSKIATNGVFTPRVVVRFECDHAYRR